MSTSDDIAIVGVLVAMISLGVAIASNRLADRQIKQLQSAVNLFTKVTETFETEVQSLKEEVMLLRNKTDISQDSLVKAETEKQRLAQKERELTWRQLKDIGRAWKWWTEQ